MPDELDISDILPEDPTARAAAMAKALRGQQQMAQELSYYGSGKPFETAPAMMNEQAKEERQNQVQQANALREYAALKNNIAHQQNEMNLREQEHRDMLRQQGITNQREADKFQHEKEQQLNADAEKLGTQMEPLNASDSVLTQLEAELKKHKSLPGVGPITGLLPQAGISDEGKKLRSLVETAGLQGDRAISGSTGFGRSPEMATKLQTATQMLKTSTDQGIRQGAALLRELHDEAKAATLASHRPEVQVIYQARQKAAHAPQAATSAQPPQAGMVRIRHKVTGRGGWAMPNAIPPEAEQVQ